MGVEWVWNVCGGCGVWWWLRPIIVLSFAKAEQLFSLYHTEQAINTLGW